MVERGIGQAEKKNVEKQLLAGMIFFDPMLKEASIRKSLLLASFLKSFKSLSASLKRHEATNPGFFSAPNLGNLRNSNGKAILATLRTPCLIKG